MQIYENQSLTYYNLLSFEASVDEENVSELIEYIRCNTSVLGIKICGDVIVKTNLNCISNELDMQFIIPIDKKIQNSNYYNYIPYIKLENALHIKMSGNINEAVENSRIMEEFMNNKNLKPSSDFYYIFTTNSIIKNRITDIYIGVNDII